MKLYDCTVAPSPRRVRIFLSEKGMSMELVQVDVVTGDNLKPEFLAINPRGLVPVLELDDGTRIDEGASICRYIEEIQPNPPLLGTDAKSRALVDSRNRHMEDDGFRAVAEIFRNTAPGFAARGVAGLGELPAIAALAERGAARISHFFDRLESYLQQSRFVAGADFSLADITALCVVDFAGWVKHTIPDGHRKTRAWYEAVAARPSAKA